MADHHLKPNAETEDADELTPQELAVWRAVSHGLSDKEAADLLGLKAKTIANYLYSLRQKLAITDSGQRMLLAKYYARAAAQYERRLADLEKRLGGRGGMGNESGGSGYGTN
jgi:DNA-binding NarL/FixJ family response regulator